MALPGVFFFFFFLVSTNAQSLMGCTAVLVGKKGTYDGSVFNGYTADTKLHDFRLGKVPASSYLAGSQRRIYSDRGYYPRYVGYERGPQYVPENLEKGFFPWNITEPVGSIPQVDKTNGYLEGIYGIMNDKQLAFGESTCGARLFAKPVFAGGKALFCVNELSRIAMERTSTAREAIKLMGDLAEAHGFYGAEYDEAEPRCTAGETLTVSDPEEAWVFHILADDTGTSAVWAAQRVKDDHFAVVGNEFIIRRIDLSNPDEYMASKNVFDVAIRQNFWAPPANAGNESFDFSLSYAFFPLPFVEITPPRLQWAARRPWRLLHLAAPSLQLKPSLSLYEYPFSVKVDKKLEVFDIFAMLRDHYEGTEWDMTKGFGAGPYGDPNRFGGNPENATTAYTNATRRGTFQRSTSVTSVAYQHLCQSRNWLPDVIGGRVWFSPHSPHSGAHTLVYAHTQSTPTPLATGSLYRFTFQSTWWVFCLVTNYVQRAWVHLYPMVVNVRDALEKNSFLEAQRIEERAYRTFTTEGEASTSVLLTKWSSLQADKVLKEWTDLFYDLVTNFHDGVMVDSLHAKDISYHPVPWPLWWLEQAGYFNLARDDKKRLSIPLQADLPPPDLLPTYPLPLSSLNRTTLTTSTFPPLPAPPTDPPHHHPPSTFNTFSLPSTASLPGKRNYPLPKSTNPISLWKGEVSPPPASAPPLRGEEGQAAAAVRSGEGQAAAAVKHPHGGGRPSHSGVHLTTFAIVMVSLGAVACGIAVGNCFRERKRRSRNEWLG